MKLGQYEVFALREGVMRVDGGAAFGPIPKMRWERRFAPDEDNRITLRVKQVLITGKGFNLLVDTGFGDKLDERTTFIYGIRREKTLTENLAQHGLKPSDITHVIFSHLHSDHAGGSTCFDASKTDVRPTFPGAEHFVQEGEWREACAPNELTRISYFFENFLPLASEAKLRLLKGDQEILEGIRVQVTGGHTRFHQMVKIESGRDRLYIPGDILPTSFHLPLLWRSSTDLFPMDLFDVKKRLLETVLNSDIMVFLGHDPESDFVKVKGSPENPYAIDVHD